MWVINLKTMDLNFKISNRRSIRPPSVSGRFYNPVEKENICSIQQLTFKEGFQAPEKKPSGKVWKIMVEELGLRQPLATSQMTFTHSYQDFNVIANKQSKPSYKELSFRERLEELEPKLNDMENVINETDVPEGFFSPVKPVYY